MTVQCNIYLASISDKFIDLFCEVKELFGDLDIDIGLRGDAVG